MKSQMSDETGARCLLALGILAGCVAYGVFTILGESGGAILLAAMGLSLAVVGLSFWQISLNRRKAAEEETHDD